MSELWAESLTSPPRPTTSLLHEFFDLTVQEHPTAPALVIPPGEGRPERREFTYLDLDRLAKGYSQTLAPICVGECIVALLVPRTSEHLWAAQLGSLRLGAAYVCIDPGLPDELIRHTLNDAQPVAVVTDSDGLDRLSGVLPVEIPIFEIREICPTDEAQSPAEFDGSRLAYLIYTSGTTGLPKGVMIENRSVSNLVQSDLREFRLKPSDRVAQGSSASYDSSIEETWLAFASGATLVVMDDATVRLGPDLVDWLKREQITVLCPPPTLLRSMGCEHPETDLPQIRLLYVGGEALTPDVADAWSIGRRLENGYGPTECTVTCVRTQIAKGDLITIGKPIDGMNAYVLDKDSETVCGHEMGELCLGGVGLARGYRNASDLTNSKFIVHPKFGRIYKTGDLVRFESDGNLSYFGRIDAQVKLRGYRIELEAIETVLSQFDGVREAACKLQRQNGREWLSAHLVPNRPGEPIDFASLRDHVSSVLPSYMVPSAFAVVDELPKSVSGKIRREGLKDILPQQAGANKEFVPPSTLTEELVAHACSRVLGLDSPPSVAEDFFSDLGGSSLLAAQLVSILRRDPSTAAITVRDVYEGRTIERISLKATPLQAMNLDNELNRKRPSVVPITTVQGILLLAEAVVGSAFAAWLTVYGLPWFDGLGGVVGFLVLWPIVAAIGFLLYAPVSLIIAAAVKKIVVGRYEPSRSTVWGSVYLRTWIVRQVLRIVPWQQFEGTEFACIGLRMLGAKIGKRVHFHHGALPLSGGWDLLQVGDDATICQDARISLVDYENGQVVIGPISIGSGVTVGVRANVGPFTRMGDGSCLTTLSSLAAGADVPSGERWEGIRAEPAGQASQAPQLSSDQMSPLLFGFAMMSARAAIGALKVLPLQLVLICTCLIVRRDTGSFDDFPFSTGFWTCLLSSVALMGVSTPLMLLLEAKLCRWMGSIRAGVIPLRSLAYVRVCLKTNLVESSGRWLSGTLFWPVWLRAAGMKVGRDCEISTIIDVVPELVDIGESVFFADGVYLGPPEIDRGTVTLGNLKVSKNTFIGNHAVLPAGQTLPEDILLGVCTVADQQRIRPGTSWFGLPPMELPRREIISVDENLTHRPAPIRYWNRVFWESLRFVVPSIPLCSVILWYSQVCDAAKVNSGAHLLLIDAPWITIRLGLILCSLVLCLKWCLLGRVKEGIHPLWSCWCSRWDFFYVAWGEWARPVLVNLEGTLLLVPYLRAMGMKIGKRVMLSSGFAHVVDPDMLIIDDDATVSAAFQAHTFEDRVLKIGKVHVEKGATLGRSTVPLYGAVIGQHSLVAANSVIMKHEVLLPGQHYEGAPTRATRLPVK